MAKIYRIINLVNSSTYIGMTTRSINERWKEHISESRKDSKNNSVYQWVEQFGKESFKIEQIDETFYRHRLIVEQYYIDQELKKNTVCINKNHKSEDFKQLMSLITSDSKNGMYGRKGENALNGQTVYMLDDDGNIVKTFISVRLALEYLGIKGHVGLQKAVRNRIKYHGYYWKKTNKQYA